MEIKQYIQTIRRWAWLLIVCTTIGGVTAFAVSRMIVPIYEAKTTLLVDIGSRNYNDLLVNQILAKTFESLMNKQPVLEQVVANLNLELDPRDLADNIQTVASPNGQLIILTVSDTDPQRAADIANEITKVFSAQDRASQESTYALAKDKLIAELAQVQQDLDHTRVRLDELKNAVEPDQVAERQQLEMLTAQYRSNESALVNSFETLQLREPGTESIHVVEPAHPSDSPVWPRTLLNVVIAAFVAGVIALGAAFLIEHLDESLKSEKEIREQTGLPTLVTIEGQQQFTSIDDLATVVEPGSQIAEAYRQLRRLIDLASDERPIHTIAVTSSHALDDTSTVVANLAVTAVQTGKRVVIIDSNLREPRLHDLFERANGQGLTTALLRQGSDVIGRYAIPTEIANLRLMPGGPQPPNAPDLLETERLRQVIGVLKQQADLIIFDTSPLATYLDALPIVRACDTTLLIARLRSTHRDSLKQATEQLTAARAHVLGVIVTAAKKRHWGFSNEKNQPRPYRRRHHGTELLHHHSTTSQNGVCDDRELKTDVS